MRLPPSRADRPFAITAIASFQIGLAAYLIYFVLFALLSPSANLGRLRSALRLLFGRTDHHSYSGSPHGEIEVKLLAMVASALVIAAYAAITGWGLWRLKKWARHGVAGLYGGMTILWLRSLLFFGVTGGFSRVPSSKLQPVYIVIILEAMIWTTLLFHGGVAESFGEVE